MFSYLLSAIFADKEMDIFVVSLAILSASKGFYLFIFFTFYVLHLLCVLKFTVGGKLFISQ